MERLGSPQLGNCTWCGVRVDLQGAWAVYRVHLAAALVCVKAGLEEAQDAALTRAFLQVCSILCCGCRYSHDAAAQLAAVSGLRCQPQHVTHSTGHLKETFCVMSPFCRAVTAANFTTGCRPAGLCGSEPAFQGRWDPSRAILLRRGCLPGPAAPARADGEVFAQSLSNSPRGVKQPERHAVLSWRPHPGGGGTGACYRGRGFRAGKSTHKLCC